MKWSITDINAFSTMLLFAINLFTQYLIDVALITFDLPYYYLQQYTTGVNSPTTPTKSSTIQTPPVNQLLEPVFEVNQSTPVPASKPVIKITEATPKIEITTDSESQEKGKFMFYQIINIQKCSNMNERKCSINKTLRQR